MLCERRIGFDVDRNKWMSDLLIGIRDLAYWYDHDEGVVSNMQISV
jgi:hypothetical protein